MSAQTPESKLKSEVLELLMSARVFYRRMHSGSHRVKRGYLYLGPEGTADFLVFKSSLPIWVELKAEGMKTSKTRAAAQANFRDEVEAIGHKYYVVLSAEQLESILGRYR